MKKALILILALALCLSFCACGKTGSPASEAGGSKPPASNDAPVPPSEDVPPVPSDMETEEAAEQAEPDTGTGEAVPSVDIWDWTDALAECGFSVILPHTGEAFRDFIADPGYDVERIDSMIAESAEDGWNLTFVDHETAPWEGDITCYHMDSESIAVTLYDYFEEETDSYIGLYVEKDYAVEKGGYSVARYSDIAAPETRCVVIIRIGNSFLAIQCGNETVDVREPLDRLLQQMGFEVNGNQ